MFSWLRSWLKSPPTTAVAEPAKVKASGGGGGMMTVGGGTTGPTAPSWNETDTRRHHKEWVYAAVRCISSRIAAEPIRVGRKVKRNRLSPSGKAATGLPAASSGGDVRELPDHELHAIFDQPNPYLTEFGLISLAVSALQLSGVAFIWVDSEGSTTRLWFLPAGWCYEDKNAAVPLSQWTIRPEASTDTFDVTSAELIRIASPDVANPFQPISPLRAAIRSVVSDEQILESQNATFSNGGKPGLLVSVGSDTADSPLGSADDRPTLTRDQRTALRRLIKDATSGAANSGEPIILDAYIRDVKPYTLSPVEMDYTNSSLLVRDRVLGIFGVPEILLGLNDNANRASAVIADESFCYGTCRPIVRLISDHLTSFFRLHYEDPDLVVWIEEPKPRDDDSARANMDQLIRAGAVTLDEVRARAGLPPLPDGKGQVLVRTGQAPPTTTPATNVKPPARDSGKGKVVLNIDNSTGLSVEPVPNPDAETEVAAVKNRINGRLLGRTKQLLGNGPPPTE